MPLACLRSFADRKASAFFKNKYSYSAIILIWSGILRQLASRYIGVSAVLETKLKVSYRQQLGLTSRKRASPLMRRP
jgi:hypothetical protein